MLEFIILSEPEQSSTWGNLSADKAMNQNYDLFNYSRTCQGVGQYWTAKFDRSRRVNEVKILNRSDALGERLANAHVTISGKDFGFLPSETFTGEWYVLKS